MRAVAVCTAMVVVATGCTGGSPEISETVEAAEYEAAAPGFTECHEHEGILARQDAGLVRGTERDEAPLRALEEYGAAHPDVYGGVWLAERGQPTIAVTDEIERHVNGIADAIDGGPFTVVQVRYPLRDLEVLQGQLTRLIQGGNGPAVLVGRNERNNVVRVGVDGRDEAELVMESVPDERADAVCIELDVGPAVPGPLRPGAR